MSVPPSRGSRRASMHPGVKSAETRGAGRARQPWWTLLLLLLLFLGPIATHGPIFGDYSGLIAATVGVLVGLLISAAATRWRWDALSVLAALLAAYLLLGGGLALGTTCLFGVIPTGQTLQLLVLGSVQSWKDLLTLTPPASSYVGPALVPWISGLVLSTFAGLVTLRWGRAILGTIPIILMGVIGIAFGPSGTHPRLWPVVIWWTLVLLWWAVAALRRRITVGEDIIIGKGAKANTMSATASSTSTRSRSVVNLGRRLVSALIMTGIGVGIGVPTTIGWGPWDSRIVARDLVEPPLDLRDYPSPLAAFRHYTTDLESKELLSVSGLPESARVRFAVVDVYDGTTFGMSGADAHPDSGFRSVGSRLPEQAIGEGAVFAEMHMRTSGLIGPWVPSLGNVETLTFTGENARALQKGLHANLWSDSALTTAPNSTMDYAITSYIEPKPSDGQLADVETLAFHGCDEKVPEDVAQLATTVTAKEQSPLARVRAIERYLSENGFYSNEDAAHSRPGHRADRLQRMLEAEQLIGDDEQYATLMALMLHSLGINARVVMGFYSQETFGDVVFYGSDMRMWVEVEFEGVGWGVFDPTPPRDQKPQTDVPEPKSVPRPQVLQPPEPPEEPTELPPVTSDRDTESEDDDRFEIPWRAIVGVSGVLLVLIGPIVVIVLAKALRRRARRRGPDPHAVLVGSWDEVVDMATDAGITVSANKTRQETAWELTSLWSQRAATSRVAGIQEGGTVGTQEGEVAGTREGRAAGLTAVPGWTLFEQKVPTTVAIARRADIADFAEDGAFGSEALLAWKDVDTLRRDLRGEMGVLGRIRFALSLRSLRARNRRARAARAEKKRLTEQGDNPKGRGSLPFMTRYSPRKRQLPEKRQSPRKRQSPGKRSR